MNKLLKQYWYVLLIILILPIGLNFALRLNTTNSIIGDSETWLAFWSTYLASILGSLITLYVLFKTLKQNEANNKDSKDLQLEVFEKSKNLQIAIYQKGLEERRIQELAHTFKESLHFIDNSKITYYQRLLRVGKLEEIEKYFLNEITRGINADSSYELDYISTGNDKNLDEYKDTFNNIIDQYVRFSAIVVVITDILQRKGLKGKIDRLNNYFNPKINITLSDDEYSILIKSEDDYQFVSEIVNILNHRVKEYFKQYGELHKILKNLSKQILTDKKVGLMN